MLALRASTKWPCLEDFTNLSLNSTDLSEVSAADYLAVLVNNSVEYGTYSVCTGDADTVLLLIFVLASSLWKQHNRIESFNAVCRMLEICSWLFFRNPTCCHTSSFEYTCREVWCRTSEVHNKGSRELHAVCRPLPTWPHHYEWRAPASVKLTNFHWYSFAATAGTEVSLWPKSHRNKNNTIKCNSTAHCSRNCLKTLKEKNQYCWWTV